MTVRTLVLLAYCCCWYSLFSHDGWWWMDWWWFSSTPFFSVLCSYCYCHSQRLLHFLPSSLARHLRSRLSLLKHLLSFSLPDDCGCGCIFRFPISSSLAVSVSLCNLSLSLHCEDHDCSLVILNNSHFLFISLSDYLLAGFFAPSHLCLPLLIDAAWLRVLSAIVTSYLSFSPFFLASTPSFSFFVRDRRRNRGNKKERTKESRKLWPEENQEEE